MAMCWTDQHGRLVSLSGDSDTESLSSVSSETLAQFYTPRGASVESSDDSVTLCELEETDNLEREGFVMVENNNTSRVGDEKHGTVGGRTCDCCSHDSCAPLRRSNWCARVYELHEQPGYSMSHLECDDKLNDHLGRERSDYDYTFVEDKVRGETEYRILLRLKPGVAPLSEDEMQQLECAFLDGSGETVWLLSLEGCDPCFFVRPLPCCVVGAVKCLTSWVDVAESELEESCPTLCMDLVCELGNADKYPTDELRRKVRRLCRSRSTL
ncbi:hypothetical protein VFPFJ_11505 [Purpureocillium lilacinum]|uniref:Uncharacterized protein n=1 Tax=Purpureocillium lilacinum TaxID=33203 RepID=A0A179F4W7_PURLI|nr:hypothetical protein VFPFJ_11505 [Purpureocillium lilacinum]OAQ60410.1 hypothetical protein VFPFJ_11505 [Purpureocillium lilacinum]